MHGSVISLQLIEPEPYFVFACQGLHDEHCQQCMVLCYLLADIEQVVILCFFLCQGLHDEHRQQCQQSMVLLFITTKKPCPSSVFPRDSMMSTASNALDPFMLNRGPRVKPAIMQVCTYECCCFVYQNEPSPDLFMLNRGPRVKPAIMQVCTPCTGVCLPSPCLCDK